MNKVRLGIIGTGNIGRLHLENATQIDTIDIAAVCDIDQQALAEIAGIYNCLSFTNTDEMFASGKVDAVLIATPHYAHTTVGIAALQAGLHVLVEKPISVHKADCEKLIAAHTDKSLVFAAMFNQRTDPKYKKLKQLIDNGELGDIHRTNWVITDWFRPHVYYQSGSWRATWAGEGGGVLLNQCPHQLDLFQWLFGMPVKICAFCHLGKRHQIEVEDDVTAYLEYGNGATGVFIASTGEAPGTNRLEIAAERGKVIVENDELTFVRNEIPVAEFSRTTKDIFAKPDTWHAKVQLPPGSGGEYKEILENFAEAILNGTQLIAPAEEGIYSVELANAMLYSSLKRETINLPLDGKAYEKQLKELIAKK